MPEKYWAIELDLLMEWTLLTGWQVWQWLWVFRIRFAVVFPLGKFCELGLRSFSSLGFWPWFGHWGMRSLPNSCTEYIVNLQWYLDGFDGEPHQKCYYWIHFGGLCDSHGGGHSFWFWWCCCAGWDQRFLISLTLNCLPLVCLLLFLLFCFLLAGPVGTGDFCIEGVLGLSGWLGLEHGWFVSGSFNSRYVCIFWANDGYGHSLGLHGLDFIIWVMQSLLKVGIPLTDAVLTSTSMVSSGSKHWK